MTEGQVTATAQQEAPCPLQERRAGTLQSVPTRVAEPWAWGASVAAAVDNASYLEEVATMAYCTLLIDPKAAPVSKALLDRHFLRKHGSDATYGQGS